jgi:hypothetical protein
MIFVVVVRVMVGAFATGVGFNFYRFRGSCFMVLDNRCLEQREIIPDTK